MATLKEHQAAMVDLLANGSGIPASASRLAHAMHDVLSALLSEPDLMAKAIAESKAIRDAYTTPGLNDKALSKPQNAVKTDSPAKWPTPAEQRVKELENTIRQLKANNAKLRADKCELEDQVEAYRRMAITEQAGCRKEDTQVCEHHWLVETKYGKQTGVELCSKCGFRRAIESPVCAHDWVATLQDDFRTCSKCHREELI